MKITKPNHAMLVTIILVLAYFIVANLVFALRHPWATETERFMYMDSALKFERVPYKDMRKRED